MNKRDISTLADVVAAAGIAALAVTHPVEAAAVKPLLERVLGRLNSQDETKRLREKVSASIAQWAESERLSEHLPHGMMIATTVLCRHGLLEHQFRELGYDPDLGTAEIISRARQKDPGWARGPHCDGDPAYALARQAIRVTLGTLVEERPEVQVMQTVMEGTVELNQRLDTVRRELAEQQAVNDILHHQLVSHAEVCDLLAYLDNRIKDWDHTPWLHAQRPSQIERRLSMSSNADSSQTFSTAEVLDAHEHVVILGGPGAGKSWLAQRIARESAEAAKARLAAGAAIDQVQLPILLTWTEWTKHSTETRSSLIDASFSTALGLRDLGDPGLVERIKRTLAAHNTMLVVIDSLDESADKSNTTNRVTSLENLVGWRSVITSRHSAWEQRRSTRDRDGVFEIKPLSWIAEAQPFIRSWLSETPDTAEALITRIDSNAGLRRSAQVPLLLTFYCMYAATSEGTSPLPVLRRDLYDHIVEELLSAGWKDQVPPEALDEAMDLLTQWAWRSVMDAVTPAGLGAWGESFDAPQIPAGDLCVPVGHVAPQRWDAERRRMVRRFRHRTLQEHLVARHIATLPVEEATQVLLPHLWFDPDWQVAAPAAIAAHPERNSLLDRIRARAIPATREHGRGTAHDQVEGLLMDIIAESTPSEWTEPHQTQLHRVRVAAVTSAPREYHRTAHWGDPNGAIKQDLIRRLPTAAPWAANDIAAAIAPLELSIDERATVRTTLIGRLLTTNQWNATVIATTIAALEPTGDERAIIRAALINHLPTTAPCDGSDIASVIAALCSTGDERATARIALINHLPTTNPWNATVIASVIAALCSTGDERATARIALINHLPTTNPWAANAIATTIVALDPTSDELAIIRIALITHLLATDMRAARVIATTITSLCSTGDERATARTALINHLPTTDPRYASDIATTIVALEPTGDERAIIRTALINHLPTPDPRDASDIATTIVALEPTGDERPIIRTALLNRFFTADPGTAKSIANTIASLCSTGDERATVRTTLINRLSTTEPWTASAIATTIAALEPTSDERATVRTALINHLATNNSGIAKNIADTMVTLEPTSDERAAVRTALINRLPTAYSGTVWDIAITLASLCSTSDERATLRTTLINHLPTEADPWDVSDIADTIAALEPTSDERAALRTTLVDHLPTTSPWVAENIATTIALLCSTSDERATLRTTLIKALARDEANESIESVRLLRKLCSIREWLAWMNPDQAQPVADDGE